jgi:hypothetical protein
VLPGGWTQFVGAIPVVDGSSTFDLHENRITVGDTSFVITDVEETVSQWLGANDNVLSRIPVTRKQGLIGETEAGYVESKWILEDYGVADYGSYRMTLVSVIKPMTRGLYEEFDNESRNIENDPLSTTGTSITLEVGDYTNWREPGYALLNHKDSGVQELIAYSSISGTTMTVTQRALHGVGGDPSAGANGTGTEFVVASEIRHVWVKRGHPVDVMLELLTTTDTGTNGSYDQGDGDGLGLDVDFFDVTAIEAIRTDFWGPPVFAADGSLTSGTAILLVESEPVEDLKEFTEDHFLRPYALKPIVTAENRFSVETYYRVPPQETVIGNEWNVGSFRPGAWSRNYPDVLNSLRGLSDWDAVRGKYDLVVPVEQDISQTRYQRSKTSDVMCRGGRTGRRGFPDYSSDDNLGVALARILLETSNPWTTLVVRVFYKYRDVAIGDSVQLNVPGVLHVQRGIRGLTDKVFFVDAKRVNNAKGYIQLSIRERRSIGNPAFVAPNTVDTDYDSASDADRQFAYICESLVFDNGDEAYTVV